MGNNPFEKMPLVPLAVSLMAGIVIWDNMSISFPLWPMFVAGVVITLLLWRHAHWQSAGIVLCFLLLGALLSEQYLRSMVVVWPQEEVCYEAVVLSEPVEKQKTMAVDILLPANNRKLKCYIYKDERSRGLKIGDGLRLQSQIKANSDRRTGRFDYHRYLEVHGFTGYTFVTSWKWQKAQVSLKNLSYLTRTRLFFLRMRTQLLHRLSAQGMDGDAYAVVAAMALGDKSALSEDVRDVYSITGASHVLALSGLHLGIIYMLLSLVAPRRWQVFSQIMIILSIWAFVFLAGMSVSVVRSAIMLTVYALLALGRREKMSVNTLAFTAIILLIINPWALFDIGFQLSFMAVLSIFLWLSWAERLLSPSFLMSHRFVRWLWSMTLISVAAQIGVAPLIAYYFGRFSTFFLLTNFVVVPAATVILYLSLIVLLFPPLAYLLIYIVGLLNAILLYISDIPGACIGGLHPTILQISMVYVIIGAVYLLLLRLPLATYNRASGGYR